MEWIIMIFPMIVDQMRLSGQDAKTMSPPAFSTSAKLHQGMLIADLIKQAGMPTEIEDSIYGGHMLVYIGDICVEKYDTKNCYIHEKGGKVTGMARIKPQYMGGL